MRKMPTAWLAMLLCAFPTFGAQQDARGCKDNPLFTRMPGYWIRGCDQKQFDSRKFTIAKGKTTDVEGQFWTLTYYPSNDPGSKASDLQILRNYENAVQKLGGTVVYGDKGKRTFKLSQNGKEIWVELWAEFTGKYGLNAIQKGEMAQDVVGSAAVFSNDIRATGHAAVYGIYFDTNKSDIKPESSQAIREIAKLLKGDPGLKVFVVGHTDNTGTVDGNMKLSQSRAESVMQALVRDHGIATSRLRAQGCGQLAPVATNDTDEGRAKNRRVELVKL